jgi:predicted ATPase
MDEIMKKDIASSTYKKVFLFERLPLVKEDYRPEPEEEIVAMDRHNQKAYMDLGHNVVHVPVMPIEERLAFILNNL